jgi:hypothetical protein
MKRCGCSPDMVAIRKAVQSTILNEIIHLATPDSRRRCVARREGIWAHGLQLRVVPNLLCRLIAIELLQGNIENDDVRQEVGGCALRGKAAVRRPQPWPSHRKQTAKGSAASA